MSINSAMLAGVSGLTANSAALAAISDNIANVNTVGYKRVSSDFQTIVAGSSLPGRGYSAGGVMASTRHWNSQPGILQRTNSSTDLGIDGAGFFVVTEKAEDLTAADSRLFTRAGSFQVDTLGYLKNSAGLYLQGWPVNDNGEIITDPSDLTRLQSINVGTVGGTAEPTTRVGINANLESIEVPALPAPPPPLASQPAIYQRWAAYTPNGANSMSEYDPDAGTGTRPDFELQVPVSDTKGGKRTVVFSFLKTLNPNEWQVEIHASPKTDVQVGAGLGAGQLKTGRILFTPEGRLDVTGTNALGAAALFPDISAAQIVMADSASPAPAAGLAKWATGLGVGDQTISFDLATAAGGLTQYDSPSVVQATTTNGTTFGNLTEVEIDDDGFVSAIFDNGVVRQIAQVAVATFPSPDSLLSVSGNAWQVSKQSGTYNLKAPGTGGAGFLAPSQLEASTVDLSSEFTGLITTQRAYSASSKIITTADQMLEELIMIKR
jgi:flagellar hook protein FlgE